MKNYQITKSTVWIYALIYFAVMCLTVIKCCTPNTALASLNQNIQVHKNVRPQQINADSLWYSLKINIAGQLDTVYVDDNLLRFEIVQSTDIRIEGVYDMQAKRYFASIAPYKVYIYGKYRLITSDYKHWKLYDHETDIQICVFADVDHIYIINAEQKSPNMRILLHNITSNQWELRQLNTSNNQWKPIPDFNRIVENSSIDLSAPSGTFEYVF